MHRSQLSAFSIYSGCVSEMINSLHIGDSNDQFLNCPIKARRCCSMALFTMQRETAVNENQISIMSSLIIVEENTKRYLTRDIHQVLFKYLTDTFQVNHKSLWLSKASLIVGSKFQICQRKELGVKRTLNVLQSE